MYISDNFKSMYKKGLRFAQPVSLSCFSSAVFRVRFSALEKELKETVGGNVI